MLTALPTNADAMDALSITPPSVIFIQLHALGQDKTGLGVHRHSCPY